MEFSLTKEQIAFQQQVREAALKYAAPGAIERDENADFEAVLDISKNKMGSLGYSGINFPKEYGGLGLTNVEYVLYGMEMARVDSSVSSPFSVNLSLGGQPIYMYGTEEQKQKYLVPLAKGEKVSAFGLTEENAGSDSAMQETVAVLDGDSYVLNGKKIYITNAGYADIYIIMAMTDKSKGAKGISAFIVEKETPGLTTGNPLVKMGIRSTMQQEVYLKDVRIPKENILGKEGEGFKAAMKALDVGRLGIAAQGVGLAWGALDIAAAYTKERYQFGQPICANQGISFLIADMATKVEAAKWLLLNAAWKSASGLPFSKEAAMAKLFCSETAMEVTTQAVQMMGGKGFLRENEVERFMRDAKITQIYEGTNQVQRMVVSGAYLKEAGTERLI